MRAGPAQEAGTAMGQRAGEPPGGGRGKDAGWRQWLPAWPPWRRTEPGDTRSLATTLPAPGRGRALRAAHRTLRRHLRGHPAMKQLLPHLWALERTLSRHGSAALMRLPVPVLERALRQLALLQRDDEPPEGGDADHAGRWREDAQDLRVLRLRLIETIELRRPLPGIAADPSALPASALDEPDTGSSGPGSSAFPTLPGLDVSELPGERWRPADVGPGELPPHRPHRPH